MKFKSSVFILCVIFLIKKSNAAVIIDSTPLETSTPNSQISTVCSLIEDKEAYCVPLQNCLGLIQIIGASRIDERKCGPRNENATNPSVCCEKYLLYYMPTISKISTTEFPSQSSLLSGNAFLAPPSPQAMFEVSHASSSKTENHEPSENCGFQNVNSRIFGGFPASEGEFPWLGRLLRRDNEGETVFSCTGSLISARVVLTSAHCLVSRGITSIGELYAVSLGEHETQCSGETECLKNKRTVLISSFIAHPLYNTTSRNHANDIGLVILRDKLKFTDHISPICVLNNKAHTNEYFIGGWGKTENGSSSGVKLKTTIPLFRWEECEKKYRMIQVNLTSHQICAGGVAGSDSCQGDSGGPLMFQKEKRWYVAGVVSFGVSCGREGWPGIYINVTSYANWIQENIRQYQ